MNREDENQIAALVALQRGSTSRTRALFAARRSERIRTRYEREFVAESSIEAFHEMDNEERIDALRMVRKHIAAIESILFDETLKGVKLHRVRKGLTK